jgi:hypothetical protein
VSNGIPAREDARIVVNVVPPAETRSTRTHDTPPDQIAGAWRLAELMRPYSGGSLREGVGGTELAAVRLCVGLPELARTPGRQGDQ